MGSNIKSTIMGPLGFIIALFALLTLASLTVFTDISDDIKAGVDIAIGFIGVYMILWVVNLL